jgi:gamma-glutamyltranspeptidase
MPSTLLLAILSASASLLSGPRLHAFVGGHARAAKQPATAAHDPAYAHDGRLAVSVHGDLWIVSTAGTWNRLTSGPAWDREPAWSPDGAFIVFSSDRAGNFDLWRVAVPRPGTSGGGASGTSTGATPERITTSADFDGQPAVGIDGRVFFVRGRLGAARLWVRDTAGVESRLTSSDQVEQWPALSPDGARLAYVADAKGERTLRIRSIGSGADSAVLTDARVEHPAWSADGARISVTLAAARGRGRSGGANASAVAPAGVYVLPARGGYMNLLNAHHAESAWSPDGKQVAIAELTPQAAVAYNGDPDRTGDREADMLADDAAGFWVVEAPPDRGTEATAEAGPPALDRAERNADAFDQLWDRTAALYYSGPDAAPRRAKWEALKGKYRDSAVAAKSDEQLETVLHDMLREHPPYRQPASGRAAVSSAHPVATAAGVGMLARGGNVVDAAVAVSFALGVVEPDASGPGGYGQMLVYKKGMDQPRLIEFMTRVPEHAGLDNTSLLKDGRLPDDGPAVVNVPGTVAAMYLAWQKYGSGKLPWADLLAPAIRAARDGYVVSEGLATTLATEREHFMKYASSRKLFFPHGEPLHAGDTLRNPDLAWTLEQIAKGGADAFYKGEVAKKLVNDLHSQGNAMQLTDMARYYAAQREPVAGSYRGYSVYSSAPPVAGGAQLAATLGLLGHYEHPKAYTDDAGTLHAMISAWELVPSTRGRISDPGLWPVTTEPFTNADTARIRWRCFNPDHALDPRALRGDTLTCALRDGRTASVELTQPPACEAHGYDANQAPSCRSAGTTAFAVADADGNMVAATQTLGTWGGNFYVTPGLGFLYNDKLSSYGSDPKAYGARLPFERNGSTIAPTIVLEGTGGQRHAVMALGAAGNSWITSAVYQTLIGMIDDKLDPQAALELPRFLLGGGRGPAGSGISIQMENGFSPEVMDRLRELGYTPQIISLMGELRMGYGAAVEIRNGRVLAGADPRRSGTAGAVP